jgi:bifunctional UDP-N-acetylglucosamine pyrophosphorylase/glucosamine-1-phosphate N-acetyltransferase
MQAQSPKAAVELGGRPMASRVIDAMRAAGADRIVVVVGHRAGDVKTAIGNHVEYVVQEEQLGTGHATLVAESVLRDYEGPAVVTYADVPLLRPKDVSDLVERHLARRAAATLLTAVFDDPGRLGRIIRNPDGTVSRIVEARDASPGELAIKEINAGVYCFQLPLLFDVLRLVTNDNAQQQYYLTDAIGILVRQEQRVEAVAMESAHAGMGVDTLEDLARAQRIIATSEA